MPFSFCRKLLQVIGEHHDLLQLNHIAPPGGKVHALEITLYGIYKDLCFAFNAFLLYCCAASTIVSLPSSINDSIRITQGKGQYLDKEIIQTLITQ